MSSLTLDGAGRWAEVPQLPPEVERAAARALVDFLREVEKAVLEAKAAGPEALEELHRVWDFRSFDRAWLPFILPMLSSGENAASRSTTGSPAWRKRAFPPSGACRWAATTPSFSDASRAACGLPPGAAKRRSAPSSTMAPTSSRLPRFWRSCAPHSRRSTGRGSSRSPAHMVELTKQPLSPGDSRAILLHARHGRHPG
ncbi:MAG: hypothetical protein ACLUNV_06220 [Sutterella wadsworthensis]